jgi:hypothetical protein
MAKGEIRCAQIIRCKKHPQVNNFTNILPISNFKKWNSLSPMKLGPFTVTEPLPKNGIPLKGFTKKSETEQEIKCNLFENYWQYSKVYSIDMDDNDNITDSFFKRRLLGFQSNIPKRRIFPKKSGITTIKAYHNGEYVNYLESRKYYCSMYEKLIINKLEFLELKNRLENGENIMILGYDGLPKGENTVITENILRNAYDDETKPFGHEIVLTCLLFGVKFW